MLVEPSSYLLFVAAAVAVVAVPGPSVTIIIANSLRNGAGAGLMNVVGTQFGLAVMVIVLTLGFTTVVEQMAGECEIVRLVGAAYLIWLGGKLWQTGGSLADADPAVRRPGAMREYFLPGFLVIWSNPKASGLLNRGRLSLPEKLSGGFLIGGGMWLALDRD